MDINLLYFDETLYIFFFFIIDIGLFYKKENEKGDKNDI